MSTVCDEIQQTNKSKVNRGHINFLFMYVSTAQYKNALNDSRYKLKSVRSPKSDYTVDSIGRGSSHNIEVGPYAHDS